MIRRRAELDTDNPPGSVDNSKLLAQDCNKKLSTWLANSPGARRLVAGCCHQTVITPCEGCPYERTNPSHQN